MKVLICGATGFIGRNLLEHYADKDGVEVHAVHFRRPALARAGVTWHRVDLTRADAVDALMAQGFDIVIQAAATTSGAGDIVGRPHIHVTDNAVMNSLLFRAAHDYAVGHMVFFSCTIMYPSGPDLRTEDDFDANAPLHPRYFGAGWTKVYLEKMAEFFARQGRCRFTVLRHSNIYGPHDKYDLHHSHVFGASVAKVMGATDGTVTVWGSGGEARDLLYVDDLTACVELCLERQPTAFALYNVGSGQAVRVRDLVAMIIAASGRELRMVFDHDRPHLDFSLSVDCRRIAEEIGWRPQIALKEGIARTLSWYRTHHRPED